MIAQTLTPGHVRSDQIFAAVDIQLDIDTAVLLCGIEGRLWIAVADFVAECVVLARRLLLDSFPFRRWHDSLDVSNIKIVCDNIHLKNGGVVTKPGVQQY